MELRERLDRSHQRVYDAIPEGMVDLSDLDAARLRLAAARAARPAEPMPVGVVTADHTVASSDGFEILVRTYRSASAASNGERRPALYWIHGGGMVLGSVEQDDGHCARIADELDIVVASVGYRLAPENPYPTPLEDCYAGLEWFASEAATTEYHLDPERLAIGGASAGGGLAAGLALLARDRAKVDICFQLLVFPMLDDRNQTASSFAITDPKVWNRAANLVGWNAYLDGRAGAPDVAIHAAPARATDLAGLPPAYISVGDLDMFLDEDVDYALRLGRAGVPAELHVYPGAFHGSNNMVSRSALSQRWAAEELAALERALKG